MRKASLYERFFERRRDLRLKDRVMLTGFFDDVDLPVLYGLAEVFVFPSLYEGFGIPLLESMACGTPVVAARNSSLPEVVGDAGLYVDAEDPATIVAALRQVLNDTALQRLLTEKGLARARTFTWQRAAQSLLETYERLGAK